MADITLDRSGQAAARQEASLMRALRVTLTSRFLEAVLDRMKRVGLPVAEFVVEGAGGYTRLTNVTTGDVHEQYAGEAEDDDGPAG